jgi:LuxR family maltose regulon positive regulatory protein
MGALPNGTVTFLFTDIAGSSHLWEQHPRGMPQALARHDAILRDAIDHHGGVVFKTVGDGCCAAFACATGALAAALTAQRALAAEAWVAVGLPSAQPIRVRMALHTGVVELGAQEYLGPPLNRIARLVALGHGGQIVLSRATADLVQDELPANVTLRDLGEHLLKGLRRPEQIFQIVADDLPSDFPALRALDSRAAAPPTPASPLMAPTKLYTPPPQPNLVVRARLIQRLDCGLSQERPLTLICAPAGFGKTTLASDWISRMQPTRSIAWISLDDRDNDPAQFLGYLIAALQQVDPRFGQTLQATLQSSQLPPLAELVTLLISDIAAAEKPLLLVLDDFHLIRSEAVHRIMQLLLERQPHLMQTLILTREDPPLPLPRLRARGALTEIRERDLRFTPDEAAAFLTHAMELDLTPDAVATLAARTEGWIAGLQLAALAIQECADAQSVQVFIDSFAGTDRYILDYLVAEVLERQPAHVKQFLLQTAILERMCGSLCDAVMGVGSWGGTTITIPRPLTPDSYSRLILEELERANVFLIPLDNQRVWYRYHHLFADLLRNRLALEIDARALSGLHRNASRWYETNGFVRDAVKHAFQTGDWAYAADLVQRHGYAVLIRSEVATLHAWCSAFPEAVIQAHPALCILHAWTLALSWRSDDRPAAEARLQQAEQALAERELPSGSNVVLNGTPIPLHAWAAGHAATIRAFMLVTAPKGEANPQALIDLSLNALHQLPEADLPARSVTQLNVGFAYLALSDGQAAERALDEAARLALSGQNYYGVAVGIFYQARAVYYLGELRRAAEICRAGKKTFQALLEHPERDVPAFGTLDIALGCVHLEWNDLAEAERLLQQGLDLRQWMPSEEQMGYLALARLREYQGDQQGVLDILSRMEERWPDIAYCTAAVRVLHQLRLAPTDVATLAAAARWAQAHQPDRGPGMRVPGIGLAWSGEVDYTAGLAWAHVQIMLGRPREALAFLAPVLAVALQQGLTYRVIELSIVQALAFAALGDQDQALGQLQRALQLAQAEDFISIFLDKGAPMAKLLAQSAARSIAQNDSLYTYIERLLTAFPEAQRAERRAQNSVPFALHDRSLEGSNALVEPLSERELDVLRLLAEGLSNQQIAHQLIVAVGTVKTHIHNIYGKLNTQNRVQTIARAQELKLV